MNPKRAKLLKTLTTMRAEVDKLPEDSRYRVNVVLSDLRVMLKDPVFAAALGIAVIEKQLTELGDA